MLQPGSILALFVLGALACGTATPSTTADAGVVSTCRLTFAPSVVADDVPARQQREPSVAVESSGVIWIADNDIPDPNAGVVNGRPPAVMKVRRSTDGGKTFDTMGTPSCPTYNCGNPLLAIDSGDRVFLTYGARATEPSPEAWIYFVRIDEHADNPRTPPTVVSDDPSPRADREWIAIGPKDEIYLAYKRGYHDPMGEIRIRRSDDHGVTFAASTSVLGDFLGGRPAYPAIAVDAKGVVKVAAATGQGTQLDHVVFTQSVDHGATFSPPVDLKATPTQPISAPYDAMELYASFPVVATASDGFTHVAWSQQASGDRIDLVVASSANGVTFGAPIRVNDDANPGFHMQPSIAVDERGLLYVTWMDSRAYAGTPPAFWKMFASYSRDRGTTFEANFDLGTPIFTGGQGDLHGLYGVGEFNGTTTRNGSVYTTWTDTRSGDAAVRLAIGKCQ